MVMEPQTVESSSKNAVVPSTHLDKVMEYLAKAPQIEAPVEHLFSQGLYIRVIKFLAGTLALGHHQRFKHLNTVLQGSVAMFCDDGITRYIQAPAIFTGEPGRKFGYVISDLVWANVYPNLDDERDIEKLEERYLDKALLLHLHLPADNAEDRADYELVLEEYGLTEEEVQIEVKLANVVPIPDRYLCKVSLRPSGRHGMGIFLSSGVKARDFIVPAAENGNRTLAGRYVNHSKNPNCRIEHFGSGSVWFLAKRDIQGCIGGGYGEELTIDYRQALKMRGLKPLCQAQ